LGGHYGGVSLEDYRGLGLTFSLVRFDNDLVLIGQCVPPVVRAGSMCSAAQLQMVVDQMTADFRAPTISVNVRSWQCLSSTSEHDASAGGGDKRWRC